MKKIFHKFFLLIGVLILILACEEEGPDDFSLFTEEIVNVRGDRLIVLGRIVAFQNTPLEDHGFYVSLSNDFNSPIIISLGPTNRPGRFVGETTGLALGQKYYVRSFVSKNSELLFGNTLEFETLETALFDFTPKTQFPGETITITGRNFGETVEVFVGDRRAEVISLDFGFRITVRVPPSAGIAQEPLTVITSGKTLVFETMFNYVSGTYRNLMAPIPGFRLVDNIYFQQGERFFAGLGMNADRTPSNFLWEYSQTENRWIQGDFPGITQRQSGNSKTGYFGGGYSDLSNFPIELNIDYWYFNGETFERIPSSPHNFAGSFGFMVQDDFYIAGGNEGIGSVVYRYRPSTGNWELRPNLPFNVDKSMVYFSNGDFLYWIDQDKQVRQYNVFTAVQRIVAEYPSPFIDEVTDFGGTAIVVGEKAYVGLYNNARELWELDLNTFEWARKNPFPGNIQATNTAIFESGGKLFILRTPRFQADMEFWELDLDGFN
jgi:hypothetical protein